MCIRDSSKDQDRAVLARARENGVAIVEANVGVTLVISKGEIVALSRRVSEITYATIEIPAPASARNRNAQERSFLQWRQTEMRHRYKQGEAKRARSGPHDPDKVSHDQKGRLIH